MSKLAHLGLTYHQLLASFLVWIKDWEDDN